MISEVIKNLISDRCGRIDNVHLIYNGVPKPEVCDFPEYFDELGIKKGKYILAMCRFVPEKNLHHLITAYSEINTDFKLVLAGDSNFDDEYTVQLKDMAKAHGVVLTGFVKGRKQYSLLSNCAFYCLPSSHEGLPIALLEAMSYSVPVVVSDIPANLAVNLDSECYFPCGNVEELKNKLQEYINKPYSRVSYDMKKYDWDEIAKQVDVVYKRLK